MINRRKLDGFDADLDFLFETMTLLSNKSLSDAKSLLLMMQTLAPNSIKVKMAEYALLKEHYETSAAANLLGQMFTSQGDSVQAELNSLFAGIRCSPPEKVCTDIFTKFPSSLQKDLITLYFKEYTDEAVKFDEVLRLMKHSEFRNHQPTMTSLVLLSFKCLKTCEAALVNSPDNVYIAPENFVKSDVTDEASDEVDLSKVRPSVSFEESEEGEVVGDDDDDDVTIEASPNRLDVSNRVVRFVSDPALNVFRFAIITELLPIICKVNHSMKLDADVVFELSLTSLGFLVSHATGIPRSPILLGTNHRDLFHKNPVEYFHEWIIDISELLRWSHKVTASTSGSSTGDTITTTTLLPTAELISVVNMSLNELSLFVSHGKPYETASKKRRRSFSRSTGTSDATMFKTNLPFQSLSLLWFILVKLGYDYFAQYRPALLSSSGGSCNTDQLSWFPLSVNSIMSTSVSLTADESLNTDHHPLVQLGQLWKFRQFCSDERYYSFGFNAIDILNEKVCPTLDKIVNGCKETCFEQLLHLDLFLSNMGMRTQLEFDWAMSVLMDKGCTNEDDKLLGRLRLINVYSPDEVNFLTWLGLILKANKEADQALLRQQCADFVDHFSTVLVPKAPFQEAQPVRVTADCWMVPFTLSTVDYIGIITLTRWLCPKDISDCTDGLPLLVLDSVCLVCVLGQIDNETAYFLAEHPCFEPSAYEGVISHIEKHWNIVRQRFLNWVKSPVKFIDDAGLLNRLAQIELEFQRITGNTEQSEFLAACVACLQTCAAEPIATRLRRFIATEAETIKNYFKNIYSR